MMKFLDSIKSMYQQSPEFNALEQRLEAAEDIADPAERLLELKDIGNQSKKLIQSRESEVYQKIGQPVTGGSVAVGGVTGMTLSLWNLAAVVNVAVVPPLAAIPIAMVLGLIMGGAYGMIFGILATPELARHHVKKLADNDASKRLAAGTSKAISEIISRENPLVFAQSPRFDEAMENFPTLREKFLLSSARVSAQILHSQNNDPLHSPNINSPKITAGKKLNL